MRSLELFMVVPKITALEIRLTSIQFIDFHLRNFVVIIFTRVIYIGCNSKRWILEKKRFGRVDPKIENNEVQNFQGKKFSLYNKQEARPTEFQNLSFAHLLEVKKDAEK